MMKMNWEKEVQESKDRVDAARRQRFSFDSEFCQIRFATGYSISLSRSSLSYSDNGETSIEVAIFDQLDNYCSIGQSENSMTAADVTPEIVGRLMGSLAMGCSDVSIFRKIIYGNRRCDGSY